MQAKLTVLRVLLCWMLPVTAVGLQTVHAQWGGSPLDIGGSVGVSAQAYTASGIEARRPPLLGEMFANMNVNVFGLQTGLNLTYSTDNSRLRQSMNRLGFDSGWGWGRTAAGDVSPSFSKYSMQGTSLRGGMLEVEPGDFVFSFAGGQSRRAVGITRSSDFRAPSFRQMLYAGRIGYGSEQRTHLHLITVYGRDLMSSIGEFGEASPVENVSITPNAGLSLFGGRFYVGGELTVSTFTPDLRSDPVQDLALPSFVPHLITPREGTSVGYAGEASTRLALDRFQLGMGYSRVQPGFTSLGVARLHGDQEIVRFEPSVRLMDQRLRLSGTFSHTRNNLLDHLTSTLRQMQLGTRLMYRISDRFSISGQYRRMQHENQPGAEAVDPALLHQSQVMQTFMLAPTVAIEQGDTRHKLTLTSSYQTTDDQSDAVVSGIRPATQFVNTMATLAYTLQLAGGMTFNTTGNLLRSEAGTASTDAYGVNVGTGKNFMDNALNLTLSGGWSMSEAAIAHGDDFVRSRSQQLSGNASAAYRLTDRDRLRLRVRSLVSSQQRGDRRSFRELRATLRYQHQF